MKRLSILYLSTGLLSTLFAGYQSIISSLRYQEKIFTEESISLALTPNNRKLNEEQLRKKAKLIQTRKRVMKKFQDPATLHSLSKAHQKAISQKLKLVNICFSTVDFFRKSISFEDEYAKEGWIDQIIENVVINSLILSCKPDLECTAQEIKTKERKLARLKRATKKHFVT